MAWTSDQEQLIGDIIADEIQRRLMVNQAATIAMLFDPATPNTAKNFLKTKLQARKAQAEADKAALEQRKLNAEAALNADIALIDSILITL